MTTPAAPAPAPAGDCWTRSETLHALGRLAGGLAHDFNNLLTVIHSNASLLLADGQLSPAALDSARRITAAGERAASLTRQLLLFSGQQPWQPRTLRLNALIHDANAALRRLVGTEIRLRLELADDLPLVAADAVMLEQLLTNLVANARDALPAGGELVVRTAAGTISPADAARHPAGRPGEFLRLSVSDSGAGIAPEVLPHIFEPFFTTRTGEQRTGLGLAVAFGITELHGGWLEVDSTVGTGTRVTVFLPADLTGTAPRGPVVPAARPDHATILLLEDDELVRETTAAVLKHAGYRVLQAAAVAAAQETWQWHADRIALLLTDVVLPGDLSGLQFADKLRAGKPALRVICTSGFSREMMARLGQPPPGTIFLQKPCPPSVLLKAVRTLLETAPI